MGKTDAEEIKLLTEIKMELQKMNELLLGVRDDMKTDRSWLWKILAMTISGSFLLVGIKLVMP